MDRVTQAMDLSSEPIPGKPLIEIFDSRKILIENHCGVVSYDPQQISIKTKTGVIIVSGDCMQLSKMSQDLLCICGRIFCVNLKELQ
jgi:sporulation protein YqfC